MCDHARVKVSETETGSEDPTPPGPSPRILLVDDERMIRDAIAMLLETAFGFEVRRVSSAREALSLIVTESFDVVLLDVRMPDVDGIEALRLIRKERSSLPVVMLSSYDALEDVRESLDAGANGYVLKGAAAEQLSEAIRVATSGEGVYIHPLVAENMLVAPGRPRVHVEPLTARELEVLGALIGGATNEQLSRSLFLSQKTIKSHLSAIFRKLGASNRTEAVSKAIREGLVPSVRVERDRSGRTPPRTS